MIILDLLSFTTTNTIQQPEQSAPTTAEEQQLQGADESQLAEIMIITTSERNEMANGQKPQLSPAEEATEKKANDNGRSIQEQVALKQAAEEEADRLTVQCANVGSNSSSRRSDHYHNNNNYNNNNNNNYADSGDKFTCKFGVAAGPRNDGPNASVKANANNNNYNNDNNKTTCNGAGTITAANAFVAAVDSSGAVDGSATAAVDGGGGRTARCDSNEKQQKQLGVEMVQCAVKTCEMPTTTTAKTKTTTTIWPKTIGDKCSAPSSEWEVWSAVGQHDGGIALTIEGAQQQQQEQQQQQQQLNEQWSESHNERVGSAQYGAQLPTLTTATTTSTAVVSPTTTVARRRRVTFDETTICDESACKAKTLITTPTLLAITTTSSLVNATTTTTTRAPTTDMTITRTLMPFRLDSNFNCTATTTITGTTTTTAIAAAVVVPLPARTAIGESVESRQCEANGSEACAALTPATSESTTIITTTTTATTTIGDRVAPLVATVASEKASSSAHSTRERSRTEVTSAATAATTCIKSIENISPAPPPRETNATPTTTTALAEWEHEAFVNLKFQQHKDEGKSEFTTRTTTTKTAIPFDSGKCLTGSATPDDEYVHVTAAARYAPQAHTDKFSTEQQQKQQSQNCTPTAGAEEQLENFIHTKEGSETLAENCAKNRLAASDELLYSELYVNQLGDTIFLYNFNECTPTATPQAPPSIATVAEAGAAEAAAVEEQQKKSRRDEAKGDGAQAEVAGTATTTCCSDVGYGGDAGAEGCCLVENNAGGAAAAAAAVAAKTTSVDTNLGAIIVERIEKLENLFGARSSYLIANAKTYQQHWQRRPQLLNGDLQQSSDKTFFAPTNAGCCAANEATRAETAERRIISAGVGVAVNGELPVLDLSQGDQQQPQRQQQQQQQQQNLSVITADAGTYEQHLNNSTNLQSQRINATDEVANKDQPSTFHLDENLYKFIVANCRKAEDVLIVVNNELVRNLNEQFYLKVGQVAQPERSTANAARHTALTTSSSGLQGQASGTTTQQQPEKEEHWVQLGPQEAKKQTAALIRSESLDAAASGNSVQAAIAVDVGDDDGATTIELVSEELESNCTHSKQQQQRQRQQRQPRQGTEKVSTNVVDDKKVASAICGEFEEASQRLKRLQANFRGLVCAPRGAVINTNHSQTAQELTASDSVKASLKTVKGIPKQQQQQEQQQNEIEKIPIRNCDTGVQKGDSSSSSASASVCVVVEGAACKDIANKSAEAKVEVEVAAAAAATTETTTTAARINGNGDEAQAVRSPLLAISTTTAQTTTTTARAQPQGDVTQQRLFNNQGDRRAEQLSAAAERQLQRNAQDAFQRARKASEQPAFHHASDNDNDDDDDKESYVTACRVRLCRANSTNSTATTNTTTTTRARTTSSAETRSTLWSVDNSNGNGNGNVGGKQSEAKRDKRKVFNVQTTSLHAADEVNNVDGVVTAVSSCCTDDDDDDDDDADGVDAIANGNVRVLTSVRSARSQSVTAASALITEAEVPTADSKSSSTNNNNNQNHIAVPALLLQHIAQAKRIASGIEAQQESTGQQQRPAVNAAQEGQQQQQQQQRLSAFVPTARAVNRQQQSLPLPLQQQQQQQQEHAQYYNKASCISEFDATRLAELCDANYNLVPTTNTTTTGHTEQDSSGANHDYRVAFECYDELLYGAAGVALDSLSETSSACDCDNCCSVNVVVPPIRPPRTPKHNVNQVNSMREVNGQLRGLLKKPNRPPPARKNRVVFDETRNEFFEADYIILIREDCAYDEEDEEPCTCGEHELVRLCCEEGCQCNYTAAAAAAAAAAGAATAATATGTTPPDADGRTPQSPKYAPPIEFVDEAALSPPDGYKDNGLKNTLGGALSGHIFGAQHIQQLQVIQRLQQQRAAMLAARNNSQIPPPPPPVGSAALSAHHQQQQQLQQQQQQQQSSSSSSSSTPQQPQQSHSPNEEPPGVCTECAECAECAAKQLQDAAECNSPQCHEDLAPLGVGVGVSVGVGVGVPAVALLPLHTSSPERRITAKEIIAGEERPKYVLQAQYKPSPVTERRIVREASEDVGSAEMQPPSLPLKPGGAAVAAATATAAAAQHQQLQQAGHDEAQKPPPIPPKETSPTQISGILKGGKLWKQDSMSQSDDQNNTTSEDEGGGNGTMKRSVRFVTSTEEGADDGRNSADIDDGENQINELIPIKKHSTLFNNALRPNSAVRQLFPAVAQQAPVLTSEALRAFDESKRAGCLVPHLPGGVGDSDTLRRSMERNILRRSLIKKKAVKSDISLEDRIKLLTCDIDEAGEDAMQELADDEMSAKNAECGELSGHRDSPTGEENPQQKFANGNGNPGDKSFSPSSSVSSSSSGGSSAYKKISDIFSRDKKQQQQEKILELEENPIVIIPQECRCPAAPDLGMGVQVPVVHTQIHRTPPRQAEPKRQFLSTLAPLTACVAGNKDDLSSYYTLAAAHHSGHSHGHGAASAHFAADFTLGGAGGLLGEQLGGANGQGGQAGGNDEARKVAPDVIAGTPGQEQQDELAAFAQQEANRTEKIKKRYTGGEGTGHASSDDDEQNDYGFNKRPSVRGIKPKFSSTNEILQQMQEQLNQQMPSVAVGQPVPQPGALKGYATLPKQSSTTSMGKQQQQQQLSQNPSPQNVPHPTVATQQQVQQHQQLQQQLSGAIAQQQMEQRTWTYYSEAAPGDQQQQQQQRLPITDGSSSDGSISSGGAAMQPTYYQTLPAGAMFRHTMIQQHGQDESSLLYATAQSCQGAPGAGIMEPHQVAVAQQQQQQQYGRYARSPTRRPESPPPLRNYHQTMVLIPYNAETYSQFAATNMDPKVAHIQRQNILEYQQVTQQTIRVPIGYALPGMQLHVVAGRGHATHYAAAHTQAQHAHQRILAQRYQFAQDANQLAAAAAVGFSERGVPEGAAAVSHSDCNSNTGGMMSPTGGQAAIMQQGQQQMQQQPQQQQQQQQQQQGNCQMQPGGGGGNMQANAAAQGSVYYAMNV